MAWIPAIVASQSGNYNNRKKVIMVALIVLTLLSILILVSQFGIFNLTSSFRISFIFGSIIVLFIVFIVVLAFSVRSAARYNRIPYPYHYNEQNPQMFNEKEREYESNISNPYKVESPVKGRVKVCYCSYCGSYISPDAAYCPDCRKRIELID